MVKTMNLNNVMVLALAVAATTSVLLIHVAEATDYTVGDDMDWTIPSGGAATHATWSNSHNLVLNDVLIFNFVTGQQDLILLATKDEFDACNTTNPYESYQDPGAFQIISEGGAPGGAAASAKWTSKHKFVVGDVIIFDFDVGNQNLAFVTKENFHKCSTTAPLFVRNDPVQIKFAASSTYYITSTFHGHCKKGQKVAIHIGPSSSSAIASISPSLSSTTEAPEALLGLEILSL